MRAVEVHPPIVKTHGDASPDMPGGTLGGASAAGARETHAVIDWNDEGDTRRFAERLARATLLRNAFIALDGELGAGKTTLVRHLLRALGVAGRVKSPTYAVLEQYQGAGIDGLMLAVSHFDFYRFNDPREFDDAGFRDLFAAPGLKLAEWPGKAHGALPVADLTLNIEVLDDGRRRVVLRAATPAGRALLEAIAGP